MSNVHRNSLRPNLSYKVFLLFHSFLVITVAEVPGVARGIKTNFFTPGIPVGSLKKFQLIWSSRLAGYREHIYECLVLLYRF